MQWISACLVVAVYFSNFGRLARFEVSHDILILSLSPNALSLDLLGFRVYTFLLRGRQEPLPFYDPLEGTETRRLASTVCDILLLFCSVVCFIGVFCLAMIYEAGHVLEKDVVCKTAFR